MRHTVLRTTAAFISVAALASCSSDEADETTAGTEATVDAADGSTTTAPVLTGDPIRVMVIAEDTGPTAVEFMGDGAEAAALEINADGGIAGRPIEVEICDTENDPNQAAACARDAADGDYLALVAMWTNQEDSVLPITDAAGLANIGNFPLTAAGFTTANGFPLSGGTPFTAIGAIRSIQAAGGETASLVVPDIAGAGDAVIGILGSVVGPEAIGDVVRVPIPTPDLTPFVATADSGGDAIIAGLPEDDNVRLVRTFRESGSTDVLGLLTDDPEGLASELGDAGNGAVFSTFYKPISLSDDPAVAQFVDAMEAANLPVVSNAVYGYAAVHLLAAAADGLPTLDRASLLAALNGITDFDIGLLAPVDFTTPQTAIPGLRLFNTSLIAGHFEDGQVVIDDPNFFDAAG